jgi:hypothetical protein
MELFDQAKYAPGEYCFDVLLFWSGWGLIDFSTQPPRIKEREKLSLKDIGFEAQNGVIKDFEQFIRENSAYLRQVAEPFKKQSLEQYLFDFHQSISQLHSENILAQKIDELSLKYFHLISSTPEDVVDLLGLIYFNQN